MSEARLSVRVDEEVKKRAEMIFNELGLTLSAGINLYLNQVAVQKGIPFPLTQQPQNNRNDIDFSKQIEELKAQLAVESKIKGILNRGIPVALYDDQRKCPYLQYPDGQCVYNIDE